ncbi:MAG: ABC transporter ATP-binding protein [Deltaproteobacteria bacterium]|nr:ABC transporter ATP-binding protein [Deltaproteobacteria bacterium]
MEKILEVKNLRTRFRAEGGIATAVDGVSFDVYKGRTLGIVGESGCGKSVTSLSIMRLIPDPPGEISGGEIIYKGRDLLKLSIPEMRAIRGNEISMIFQEPMTSLNPVFTIGDQIREAILLHQKTSRAAAKAKTIEMLKLVGIPVPEKRFDEYPHQLSGGMRQRVMIAMALSCNPQVLIADEPTTALDVTIQAQILELMKKIRETLGMAMILITHDLGIIAETADEVLVMYAGKVVEKGPVKEIFANPLHPYTRGLLNSLPSLEKKKRLETIAGIVPSLLDLPKGCRFQARCPYAFEICRGEEPALREVGPAHWIACYKDLPRFEGKK